MILPNLKIVRVEDSFKYGVFGVLLIGGETFCMTLEPPEFENKKNFACIPTGQYECIRIMSRFGTTYEILNIPDRNEVLFHPGNRVEDTEGCVLLGEKLGKLKGDRAILNSGKTFTTFLNTMQSYPEFKLTIKEEWA